MIGKRELFCPSIKGKDLEQTVEITETLHYFQCQAKSMLMCYLTGSKHAFTISAVPNSGFTPHRLTIDRIATLNMILQTRREYRKPPWVAYVDFRSAFDSVDRQSLWLLLRSKGIPEMILQLLEDLIQQHLQLCQCVCRTISMV